MLCSMSLMRVMMLVTIVPLLGRREDVLARERWAQPWTAELEAEWEVDHRSAVRNRIAVAVRDDVQVRADLVPNAPEHLRRSSLRNPVRMTLSAYVVRNGDEFRSLVIEVRIERIAGDVVAAAGEEQQVRLVVFQ